MHEQSEWAPDGGQERKGTQSGRGGVAGTGFCCAPTDRMTGRTRKGDLPCWHGSPIGER
jgi:hypothetical protein